MCYERHVSCIDFSKCATDASWGSRSIKGTFKSGLVTGEDLQGLQITQKRDITSLSVKLFIGSTKEF